MSYPSSWSFAKGFRPITYFSISKCKWNICLSMRMNVFSWGWMSSLKKYFVFSWGWMSSLEEYFVFSWGWIKFIKDLEDLSRQDVGMVKTRKIGLSCRLFRDRKINDWTETFCKTPTRWIGHTNFLFIWCPRLCFGWVLSMQRKIIHSGGVTTLNPDSLGGKENLWKLKRNG